MNTILFCLIFIQVSIFFIAGGIFAIVLVNMLRQRLSEQRENVWREQPAFSRAYANHGR